MPYRMSKVWRAEWACPPSSTPFLSHGSTLMAPGASQAPSRNDTKTVSLFKNWNVPKIEFAECLCGYNLGKHLPPLCGRRSLLRILPLISGKDKSGCMFCGECFSSQEEFSAAWNFECIKNGLKKKKKQRVLDKESTRFLKEIKSVLYSCLFLLPWFTSFF